MTPQKKTAFKCHTCLVTCSKPVDAACISHQGAAIKENKANVFPVASHVTRSKTRNSSTELLLPVSVSGADVIAATAPVTRTDPPCIATTVAAASTAVRATAVAVGAAPAHTPFPTEGYITESRLTEILKRELGSTIKEQVSVQLSFIKDQMTNFHESFTYFNTQFEEMKQQMVEKDTIIEQLKTDNAQLHATVDDLAYRLGNTEQQMRENNIELNGIPEHHNENLINTVVNLAKAVDNTIAEDDIVCVTRVAKINKDNKKPRAVIVKLRSPRQRDTILAAVTTHNKKHPTDKLSSQHLGLSGTKTPVFVSEHLSPANKHLHAATRHLAKDINLKFVWVRNGRIFVRKDEFSQALLIKTFENLEQLRKASPSV